MNTSQEYECTYAEKFRLDPLSFDDLRIEMDLHGFSIRTFKRLSQAEIMTAGDLLRTKESDLRKISGFGQKCADEVTAFLQTLAQKQNETQAEPLASCRPTGALLAYKDAILNGEFSFTEERQLTDTERDCLAAIQDGCAYLEYDMIVQAEHPSDGLLMIRQMLQDTADTRGGRRLLTEAFSRIPDNRHRTSAGGYIDAFSESAQTRDILRSIYGADDAPLADILRKLSLTPKEMKLALEFVEWCAFDIGAELQKLFDQLYKKENRRIILQERSNNRTLEATGQVVGVTRERVRQIEKKVREAFSGWYTRTRILSQISAIRNGDPVLTTAELQAYFGRYTSALLYLLRTTEGLPYLYDAHADAFIVEDFDQSERVWNFVEGLPDTFNRSRLDFIRKDAAVKGLSDELLMLSVNEAYTLTGNIYHRSRLSLQKICRHILKRYFKDGMRVYDEQQLAEFRRYVEADFGDVSLPKRNRSLSSDIMRNSILCGRGIYKPYGQEEISGKLLQAICDYIDDSDKNIFLTNTLFHVFEEELLAEGIDNKYYMQGLMHRQLGDRYVFRRDYVSKDDSVTSVYMEVVNYIKKFDHPVSKKQVLDEHPGITEIVFQLSLSDPNIINYHSEYIHGDRLDFRKEDVRYFQSVLTNMLAADGYCNVRDVYARINAENPASLRRLYIMYQAGLFSVLEYLFRNAYQFSRPYIAYPDVEISHAAERMDERIRNADEISLAEIQEYGREIHLGINSILDFVDEHNDTHLLKNDEELISIAAAGIDAACAAQIEALILDEIEGTTLISELKSVDRFPEVSVPWTEWLLYSVIKKWSDKLEAGAVSSKAARQFRYMHPVVAVKGELKADGIDLTDADI